MASKKKTTDDITRTGIAPLKGLSSPVSAPQRDTIDEDLYNRLQSIQNKSYQGAALDAFSPEGTPYNAQSLGESMWDPEGFVTKADVDNLQDIRANNQSWIAQLGAGLGKMVTTAGATFINNTAGLVIGAGQAMYTGEFSKLYDNEFSNAMQDFQDKMEELMPNYYTKDEQENSMALRNLVSMNFLGDKMIKNLGFVVGSIYSGGLYSGAVKSLGNLALKGIAGTTLKAAKAARAAGIAAQTAGNSAKAAKQLANAGKWLSRTKKAMEVVSNVTGDIAAGVATGVGAIGESSMEALQGVRDFREEHMQVLDNDYKQKTSVLQEAYANGEINEYEFKSQLSHLSNVYEGTKKRIEKDAVDAGNLIFAINMPVIWGADAIWLGKMYKRGFNTEKRMAREASKNIRRKSADLAEGYETTGFSKRAKAWKLAKTPLSEGGQEWTQEFAQTHAKNLYGNDVTNYYKASLDGEAYDEQVKWTQDVGKSLAQNFNQQSAEAFLLGALTSVFGAPMIKSVKRADGKNHLKFSMEGNMFSELKEMSRDQKKTEATVAKVNERLADPKFREYWRGMARHRAIQRVMDSAVEKDNKFDFENASQTQLNSDIEMFHAIGRTDDLVEFLEGQKVTSKEEAQSLIRNTTTEITGDETRDALYESNLEALDKANNELLEMVAKAEKMQKRKNKSQKSIAKISEQIEKKQKEVDDLQAIVDHYTPKTIYHGPFVDENANRMMTDQEVMDKVNQNIQSTIETIHRYGTERAFIDSKTNHELSSEALAFLTNMSMSAINAEDRMGSILNNGKSVLQTTLLVYTGYINSLNEEIGRLHEISKKDTLTRVEKEELRQYEKERDNAVILYNNIEKLITSQENPLSAFRFIRKNAKALESSIDYLLNEGSYLFDSVEKEQLEELRDFTKLGERREKILALLNDYLKNPAKVKDKINGDLTEAINTASKERIEAQRKRLTEVRSKAEYNEARMEFEGTQEEFEEARKQVKENALLDKMDKAETVVASALKAIEENEELSEKEKEAIAKAFDYMFEKADDPDTLKQMGADIIAEQARASAVEENIPFEESDKSLARMLDAFNEAVDDYLNNSANAERLQAPENQGTLDEQTGGKEDTAGIDGPTITPNKPAPATENAPVVPVVDISVIGNDAIYDKEAPAGSPTEHFIPTTREVWSGTRHRSEFEGAVDRAKKYSQKFKQKIKAVHRYMVKTGAFDYINNGNLNVKDEVFFVVDPELNKEAGCVVVLMAVRDKNKNIQIIGDLPVPNFKQDKAMMDRYPGLNETYDSIVKQFEAQGKKYYTSPITTHVNKLYVGQIESDRDERGNRVMRKVSDIFKGKDTPKFGVVKNNTIESNDTDNTDIKRPLKMIEGCVVILVPNARIGSRGGYNIAYVAMDSYDRNNTDPDGIDPIVTEILNRLADEKDDTTIGKLKDQLSNYIYAPDFHINRTREGKVKITKGDSITVVSVDDAVDAMKLALHGSPLNLKIRALGTEVMRKKYEERMMRHMTTDLTVGSTTTINNWFSVNPLDANGVEKKGDSIPTTRTPPVQKIPLFQVTIDNTEYKADLNDSIVTDSEGNTVEDTKTKDIVLMEALLYKEYGDAMDGANLTNGVYKTSDGKFYDRKSHKFVEDPAITEQRKEIAETVITVDSTLNDNLPTGTIVTNSDGRVYEVVDYTDEAVTLRDIIEGDSYGNTITVEKEKYGEFHVYDEQQYEAELVDRLIKMENVEGYSYLPQIAIVQSGNTTILVNEGIKWAQNNFIKSLEALQSGSPETLGLKFKVLQEKEGNTLYLVKSLVDQFIVVVKKNGDKIIITIPFFAEETTINNDGLLGRLLTHSLSGYLVEFYNIHNSYTRRRINKDIKHVENNQHSRFVTEWKEDPSKRVTVVKSEASGQSERMGDLTYPEFNQVIEADPDKLLDDKWHVTKTSGGSVVLRNKDIQPGEAAVVMYYAEGDINCSIGVAYEEGVPDFKIAYQLYKVAKGTNTAQQAFSEIDSALTGTYEQYTDKAAKYEKNKELLEKDVQRDNVKLPKITPTTSKEASEEASESSKESPENNDTGGKKVVVSPLAAPQTPTPPVSPVQSIVRQEANLAIGTIYRTLKDEGVDFNNPKESIFDKLNAPRESFASEEAYIQNYSKYFDLASKYALYSVFAKVVALSKKEGHSVTNIVGFYSDEYEGQYHVYYIDNGTVMQAYYDNVNGVISRESDIDESQVKKFFTQDMEEYFVKQLSTLNRAELIAKLQGLPAANQQGPVTHAYSRAIQLLLSENTDQDNAPGDGGKIPKAPKDRVHITRTSEGYDSGDTSSKLFKASKDLRDVRKLKDGEKVVLDGKEVGVVRSTYTEKRRRAATVVQRTDDAPIKMSFVLQLSGRPGDNITINIDSTLNDSQIRDFMSIIDLSKTRSELTDIIARKLEEYDKQSSTVNQGSGQPTRRFNSIQEILDDIKERTKNAPLSEDNRYYIINGKNHARVTSVIPDGHMDKGNPFAVVSTTIGNIVDSFVRDFFTENFAKNFGLSELKQKYPTLSESTIKSLLKSLTELRDKYLIDSKGNPLHVIPHDVTLYGEVVGYTKDNKRAKIPVAGTVDLLAYDDDGNFYIFDMKTLRTESNVYNESYHRKWAHQLSLYKELFEQRYGKGIVKSLQIIPFNTPYPLPVGFENKELGIVGKAQYEAKENKNGPDILYKDGSPITVDVRRLDNVDLSSAKPVFVQEKYMTEDAAALLKPTKLAPVAQNQSPQKPTNPPAAKPAASKKEEEAKRPVVNKKTPLGTPIKGGGGYFRLDKTVSPEEQRFEFTETSDGTIQFTISIDGKDNSEVAANYLASTDAAEVAVQYLSSKKDIMEKGYEIVSVGEARKEGNRLVITKKLTIKAKGGIDKSTAIVSNPENLTAEDIASTPTLDWDNPGVGIPPVTSPEGVENTKNSQAQKYMDANVDSAADELEDLLRRVDKTVTHEQWDEQKEMEWLNKVLPNLSSKELVKIHKGLIKLSDGTEAYGVFRQSVITVADNAARGTLYHEAFHSVFHTLMDRMERDDIYKLAREKWGKRSLLELEELLAEDFREYTQDLQYASKFKRFFKGLWNMIKTLGGHRHSLNAIYYRINAGKYARRARMTSRLITVDNIDVMLNSRQASVLRDTIGSFLKNFGISIKELSEYSSEEPLFNALDRIIYYKDIKDLSSNCGYAIAFMMQYDKTVRAMLDKSYAHDPSELAGYMKLVKNGDSSLFHFLHKDLVYARLEKDEKLKVLGYFIGEQLRRLYAGEALSNVEVPFMNDVWNAIDSFFDTMNSKVRTEYSVMTSFANHVARAVKLGDVSIIRSSKRKPGSDKPTQKVDVGKALRENPKDDQIIRIMSKNGVALGGSTSIAAMGVVLRPVENPFHDLDFTAAGFTREQIETILKDNFGHFQMTNRIGKEEGGSVTYSYLIVDRPFVRERVKGKVNGKVHHIIKDANTGEVLGTQIGYTELELKDGVYAKILDFFTGPKERVFPNMTIMFNGIPYLISDWRNAMKFKVENARIKDIFDYGWYTPFEDEKTSETDKLVRVQREAEVLRNARVIWGHPAIGKTTYLKNNDDILEWDELVNPKRNAFIAMQIDPYGIMDKDSQEYKTLKQKYMGEEWRTHPEYIQFLKREWEALKKRASEENKRLFASPLPLLELFPQDFDAVVALPNSQFIERNMQRGGTFEGSMNWKMNIDAALERVDREKLIYTDKYFNEFMEDVKALDTDAYSTIKQYHREKSMYHNLSKEDQELVEQLGFTLEEWNRLPNEIREQKLVCRH